MSALPLLHLLRNWSSLGIVWGSGTSLINCMHCYDISWAYHKCHHPISLIRSGISLEIWFDGWPHLQKSVLESRCSLATFVAESSPIRALKLLIDFIGFLSNSGSFCKSQSSTTDWYPLIYVLYQVQNPQKNCMVTGPIVILSLHLKNDNLIQILSGGNVQNLKSLESSAIHLRSAMPQIVKDLNCLSHLPIENIDIAA